MNTIAFIEPKSPGKHFFSMFALPRLGCVLLATIAKKNGWDARVYIEEIAEIDFGEVRDADIVAISTVTPTAPRAYEIARRLRDKGKTVIMGGPHVTFLPDEALGHCDFVFRGEAENSLTDFLSAFQKGEPYSAVEGLSYNTANGPVHNPVVSAPVCMTDLPHPDFSLIKSKRGVFRGLTSNRIIPIQTSRGCPYACDFCSVTAVFGRKVRYRDAGDVLAELRRYSGKGNLIFFYDDNFVVNKPRTRAILEGIIAEGLRIQWTAQVRADIARDPEFLDLMRRSGCFLVYVGFESVNQKALDGARKSQSVDDIETAVREFKKAKIKIHGMFIFGLEQDTYNDTMATLKFTLHRAISTVQYVILTPMPGTAVFQRLKDQGRILLEEWGYYDGHHVVYHPKNLTVAALQKAQVKAIRRFYSVWRGVKSLFQMKFYMGFIILNAGRYFKGWIRSNRAYLKTLKLLDKGRLLERDLASFLSISVGDVRGKIDEAWKTIKPRRNPEIEPKTNP